jgi:putative tricarboxylic transport membrane protein
LFGVGELYYAFYEGLHAKGSGGIIRYQNEKKFWPDLQDWIETRMSVVRGSLLGFCIGVVPGAGATIASLVSYSVEKSVSKTPEKFGKGAMAGLVGPEAANNAASSGAMVPLLTLGIPGSASTAVLLAAFLLWGLRPGPLLMEQNPEFAWGLIASMYLGNVALLAVNIFAIPLFVTMLKLPYRILAPVVILVCTIGTFSVHGSIIEVWLMFAAGIVGFFMKLYGFSPAATVLALVLGPLAEETLRQSLIISRGSPIIFVERGVSLTILLLTIGIVVLGVVMSRSREISRRRAAAGAAGE